MTKSTITREQLLEIIETDHVQCGEASYLARMALAAMASESGCLPLDYLQGHKDGLEWAARLAEANHPETGDWLYDDPIELAKAIRKGPDMPPAQPAQPAPVVEREPIAWLNDAYLARGVVDGEAGSEDAGPGYIPVYREAGPQPAPVVLAIPDEMTPEQAYEIGDYHGDTVDVFARGANWMRQHIIDSTLAAAPQLPGSDPATVPGKWIPVSEQIPEVGDIVLTAMGGVVNVGETECSAANCRFFTSVISGRELPATHWMQLPAAPQEVGDA